MVGATAVTVWFTPYGNLSRRTCVHLNSITEIDRNYRNIYLQPHFDDAVLSCGGTIALQRGTGTKSLVITAFGGLPKDNVLSPFATQTLTRWGLSLDPCAAVERRREEDTAALEVVGADTLWLNFVDAVFRGTPPYYTSDESLFGSVHTGDLQIDQQLADLLAEIHERAPLAAIYAPLGIGHHVDHQLCSSAADRLVQQRANVKFYEDFPYVTRPGALVARQKELGIAMEPELAEVSGQIRQKEEAIAAYASQLPALFPSEDQMRQTVREYASSLRRAYPGIMVERYWRWLPAAGRNA
jgi:LmbE family N-acetylglucosaminyl deacetylase